MKKILVAGFIFITFFFLIPNPNLVSQIRRTLPISTDLNGLFYIDGYVFYTHEENSQYSHHLNSEMTFKLKKNDKYIIHDLKLNGEKYSYSPVYGGRYQVNIYPFQCNVGQVFKLEVGLKKKGLSGIRQQPEYYTVGTFKVNNLFKKYIFPAPGQVINLDLYNGPFLNFKWKYTNFSQRSLLRIYGSNLGSRRTYKVSGESSAVRKNLFVPGIEYTINHGVFYEGRDTKFTLSKFASSDSKLYFSNTLILKFKTKKRLLLKPKISTK